MVRVGFTTEQLERWAFEDELTGLFNRRRLALEIDAREVAKIPTYFVAIDLDGFKREQDRPEHGHAWGDQILRTFASFLLRSTRRVHARPDVVLTRPGGDEFLVLVDSRAGAEAVAARVLAWERGGVRASAAVGTTWKEADAALYAVKAARKSLARAV